MGNMTVSTVEWTNVVSNTTTPYPCPTGTFSGGPYNSNAQFFNSSNVNNNLVWQWFYTITPGGLGDFDQINVTRWNRLFGTNFSP
jgi:hypothetical protein